jgi:glycosyltransferase involved in cell wall biosynthesis
MDRPLVSIVLPTWKESPYLRQSVESCLAQSFTDWELILVDDGCTEAGRAIIESCARQDPRIRTVAHTENRGLPKALNTGFAMARGEYLTWTSDDNCYRRTAIETMVRALQEQPETDIVYCDMISIDAAGRAGRRFTVGEYRDLLANCYVYACFLYRRHVQEVLGGYAEDQFLVEDYDFWLRASTQFRMRPIHQDLYEYREHGESLTGLHKARQVAAAGKCLDKNLPSLTWASAVEKAECYWSHARAAQRAGDWTSACRRAGWAFRLAPWPMLQRLTRKILHRLASLWLAAQLPPIR